MLRHWTESDTDDDNFVFEETICEPGPSTNKRASTQFLTKKPVAALDRFKISDKDATHLLMATTEALGQNVDSLVINHSLIHR
jgi:adenylate/nucleoside-diphosphate kinase